MHTIFSSEPITTMFIKTWNYFFFLSILLSDSPSSHCSSSSFPPLHFLISFFSFSPLFLPKRYIFPPLLFPFLILFFLPLTPPFRLVFFSAMYGPVFFRPSKKRIPVLLPVEHLVWTEAIYSHGMCEIWFISCILKHRSKEPQINIFIFYDFSCEWN